MSVPSARPTYRGPSLRGWWLRLGAWLLPLALAGAMGCSADLAATSSADGDDDTPDGDAEATSDGDREGGGGAPGRYLSVTPDPTTGLPAFVAGPFGLDAGAAGIRVSHPGGIEVSGRVQSGARGLAARVTFSPAVQPGRPEGLPLVSITAQTDADGRYRTRLLPGLYHLLVYPSDDPANAGIPPLQKADALRVRADPVRLDFEMDRGYLQVRGRVVGDESHATVGLRIQANDLTRWLASTVGEIKSNRTFEFSLPSEEGVYGLELGGRTDAPPFRPAVALPRAVTVRGEQVFVGTSPDANPYVELAYDTLPGSVEGICRVSGTVRMGTDPAVPVGGARLIFDARIESAVFRKTALSAGEGGEPPTGEYTVDLLPAFYQVAVFPEPGSPAATATTATLDCLAASRRQPAAEAPGVDPATGLPLWEHRLDLRLGRRVRLEATFVDPHGTPVADLGVSIRKKPLELLSTVYSLSGRTDADGRAEWVVDPGTWFISATPARETGLARLDTHEVTLSTDARFGPVIPFGEPWAATLTLPDGSPLASGRVELYLDPGTGAAVRLQAVGATDSTGRFEAMLPR